MVGVFVGDLTEEFNNVSSPFGDFVVRVIAPEEPSDCFEVVVAVGNRQVCDIAVDMLGRLYVVRYRNAFRIDFGDERSISIPFFTVEA